MQEFPTGFAKAKIYNCGLLNKTDLYRRNVILFTKHTGNLMSTSYIRNAFMVTGYISL